MSLVNNHFIETALIKRGETAVLCSCLCMNCHVAAKLVHQNEYLKKNLEAFVEFARLLFATVAMQLSRTFNSCVENAKLSIKPGLCLIDQVLRAMPSFMIMPNRNLPLILQTI